jgi:hypothetical protein
MKIETLALLDLLEAILKSESAQQVHEDQIQSQLKKFKEIHLVTEIIKEIEESNYSAALELVSSYRYLCKELLSIYNCLTRDYIKLKEVHLKDELIVILNEKYGISKIKEVVNLLEQKQQIKKTTLIGTSRL